MKVRGKIQRMIGLTGTPCGNGLMDLWAEYRLLDGGERLGRSIGRYREDYFVPDKRNGQVIFSWKPRAGAEDAIRGRIADMTVSMRAADHLAMPELIFTDTFVEMDDRERGRYDEMAREMVLRLTEGETHPLVPSLPSGRGNVSQEREAGCRPLPSSCRTSPITAGVISSSRVSSTVADSSKRGGQITAANAAVLAGKLCQLANGAVYDDAGTARTLHERKLDALEDMVEAMNGAPLLIAYWFKHDAVRIEARLSQLGACFGRLDSLENIRRWNAGELTVGLIQPMSAGHGLNLQTGGSTLVWFSLPWSLELYEQTNARLWRQGQRSGTVVITHILTRGTIDERIRKALAGKSVTQNALMDAVRAEFSEILCA